MKERASFTLDKETTEVLDKLTDSGKYRNKSHVVEEAIKQLEKKEKEEQNNEKRGGKK
jgi:Arc/MetJ-type ribon-helix-helix transcriptional regulator